MELSGNISIKSFLFSLGIYLFFSSLVFLMTSAGWSGLMWLFYGSFILGTILVISIIAGIVLYYKFKRTTATIYRPLLYITLITQIFAILFNFSDHGDNPGAYTVIDLILHTPNVDSGTSPFVHFSFFFVLFYFILLCLTIFFAFSQSTQTPTSDYKIKK
ncbi:MAG TPA: hypothetical protein VLG69_04310 [Candidatus Andersenbacteria bacterium]|nr:hypothetical protein [Candidatus Andersenbacteria bacterium]